MGHCERPPCATASPSGGEERRNDGYGAAAERPRKAAADQPTASLGLGRGHRVVLTGVGPGAFRRIGTAVRENSTALAQRWRPAVDGAVGVSVLVLSATDSTFARE